MFLVVRAFLVMAALTLSADMVRAAAVEDANAAVLAARDGKYDDAIRLFTNAINSDNLSLKSRARPMPIAASPRRRPATMTARPTISTARWL